MTTWSYSGIKTFDQCPKKYYHLKVAKDVKDVGSEASIYGTDAHKAAEDHVKVGAPVPPRFKYIEPTLEALKAIPGEKHCEMKLGVSLTNDGYAPCGFFDKDVWWRGVADLVITNEDKGFVVDYKTGRNAKYADTKQLDLLAGAVFLHFPNIVRLKSALLYVVSDEFIHKEHVRDELADYMGVFAPVLDRLVAAEESGVWNANSGPLCGWCPVASCEHQRNRKWK
jgi:hypothetical protein